MENSPNKKNILRVSFKNRAKENILKANQKLLGSDKFKEHIGIMLEDLTPSHLGKVIDKCVDQHGSEHKKMSVTGWYTVTISNCLNVPNSSILLALKYALMPLKVEMFNFNRVGNSECAQFLVDNKLIANRMKRLNSKVTVLYSTKVIDLHVDVGIVPSMLKDLSLQPALLAAIKTALLARYDAKSQSLNLTRFHAAPELLGRFCALHVLPMLQKLLEIIAQEFQELRVLQLSDNFLCSLGAFDQFPRTSLPHLQVLDVGANNICGIMQLKNLRDMKLQTLDLINNPVAKIQGWQLHKMLPQVQHIRVSHKTTPPSAIYFGGTSSESEFCLQFAINFHASLNNLERHSELDMYYEKKAIFSLGVSKQLLLKSEHATGYGRLFDLNLLIHRKRSSICRRLFFGHGAVIHAMSQLPVMPIKVEESKLRVHVYNNYSRVFTLNGNFRKVTSSGVYEWYSYTRQIMLRTDKESNWLIHSDMLEMWLGRPDVDFNTDQKVADLDNQMDELNTNFNNSMQFTKGPERCSPMPEAVLEEMPQAVLEEMQQPVIEEMPPIIVEMPRAVLEEMPHVVHEEMSQVVLEEMPQAVHEVMPPLVPQTAIPVLNCKLEVEVDDTLLCSDDEMMLVVNEEELLEVDSL